MRGFRPDPPNHAQGLRRIATLEMDPGDVIQRDPVEGFGIQFGEVAKMDDRATAVGSAERDIGGRGRAAGDAHGIAGLDAPAGEIREDQVGGCVVAQGPDPTTCMPELRKDRETIGDIAAAHPPLGQGPNLLVLGWICDDLVDQIECRDAHAEHGSGTPTGEQVRRVHRDIGDLLHCATLCVETRLETEPPAEEHVDVDACRVPVDPIIFT
jgi:hypothetical protein